MASGPVCRANRPNTWLHRPAMRREDFPCQLGAVHTWQILLQKWSEEESGRWRRAASLACRSRVRAVAGAYSTHFQRDFGVT
jgi:hypothetical protein